MSDRAVRKYKLGIKHLNLKKAKAMTCSRVADKYEYPNDKKKLRKMLSHAKGLAYDRVASLLTAKDAECSPKKVAAFLNQYIMSGKYDQVLLSQNGFLVCHICDSRFVQTAASIKCKDITKNAKAKKPTHEVTVCRYCLQKAYLAIEEKETEYKKERRKAKFITKSKRLIKRV